METIGKRVRTLRIAKRMSQATLAEKVGISPQAISDIERDSTAATHRLAELARALETTAEWLKYGDQVREHAPAYRADLDRIHHLISTGRLDDKAVGAVRALVEKLAE